MGGFATAASKVAERVPGTPEHAINQQLREHGDISVDNGRPIDDAPAGTLLAQARVTAQRHADQPSDEIMRHSVAAKAPGLHAPHPPAKDAHAVQLPDPHTADGALAKGHGAAPGCAQLVLQFVLADVAYGGRPTK